MTVARGFAEPFSKQEAEDVKQDLMTAGAKVIIEETNNKGT